VSSVAWFLVRRSLQTINKEKLDAAFAQVEMEAGSKITALYAATCSSCSGRATIQNATWVKQIECRACGELVDLNIDQVVMRSFATRLPHLVDCPACRHVFSSKALDGKVRCPDCAHRFVPNEKRCVNTDYRCPCGHQDTIIGETRKLRRQLPHRLRSLTVWCETCGRVHQTPRKKDVALYRKIERDTKRRWRSLMIPRERIPTGRNTDQLRR